MKISALFMLFALSSFYFPPCDAADVSGPREPLTFQNSGLYGSWSEYFLREDTPFDFFVVPVITHTGQDNTLWNNNLQHVRKNGKRIIVDLIPVAKKTEGDDYAVHHLTHEADESELDNLVAVVDDFFKQVDVNDLYAITLGEEQIFWNGREKQLNMLYKKIKAKYDVPIYQWYSPSTEGSVPGVTGWPNLKSDGWMADEYFLDQPFMERAMRGYRVLQKPIVQIIWGGDMDQSVPFLPRRFEEQVEVCRKYDIPMAFFTWSGRPGASWGWQDRAPALVRERFNLVLKTVAKAKSDSRLETQSWDSVPWEKSVTELAFVSQDDVTPSYHESYTKEHRQLRFANDAEIKGFADLRWDSSAVELRPREAGAAQSSVTYSFKSAFPLTELRVSAPGFITGGTDGAVSMSALDMDGNVLQTTNMTAGGTMDMVVPGGSFTGREFQVVYTMTGTAASADDVLAGVNSMDVDADVVIPTQKAIDLEAGAGGNVLFEEDLRAMNIYHTAEFNNIGKITFSVAGLHAGPGPDVLEIVQKFSATKDIILTRLHLKGSADETNPSFLAKIGIGVSLDGVNLLDRKMSNGSFGGALEIDRNDFREPIQAKEFYVHLFLEGNFGLIRSYAIEGKLVE